MHPTNRTHFATRRALPWRQICTTIGLVLAIGGGIVAVSTPAAGGITFALGVLALIASAAE